MLGSQLFLEFSDQSNNDVGGLREINSSLQRIIGMPPDVKVDPSCVPPGEESQTEVKVPRGCRMELNCMWDLPFNRGQAVSKLNNISTTIPIPTGLDKGIGPRAGRVGVFWMRAQF